MPVRLGNRVLVDKILRIDIRERGVDWPGRFDLMTLAKEPPKIRIAFSEHSISWDTSFPLCSTIFHLILQKGIVNSAKILSLATDLDKTRSNFSR